MKNVLIAGLMLVAFAGVQSCSKCGHCETTTTFGTTTTTSRGDIVCGEDYYKAGKLNCEQPTGSASTTRAWVDDK